MKHLLQSASLAALILTLTACDGEEAAKAPSQTEAATQSADAEPAETVESEEERLLAFFARNTEEDLALSPEAQSYRGIKTDYDKWTDRSAAAIDARVARAKARLEALQTYDFDALSPARQLSYRLYKQGLERTIASDAFRLDHYVVDHRSGPQAQIPSFLINIHRVADMDDARAYVARLEGVPLVVDQTIEQLKLREAAGRFAPDWAWPIAIDGARNVIKGAPFDDSEEKSPLLADFETKLANVEASDEDKAALLERARTALSEDIGPAFEKLIEEYRHQGALSPAKDGVWKFPDGKDFYAERLQYFTTTSLTAEEIHQIGLDNVERIHGEMREIMKKVSFEGTLQEFFVFMRTDPQFYFADSEEGRAAYLASATALIDTMRTRLPEQFGILPMADIDVKAVEPFRERAAGKAFYQRPAEDRSRPGTFYVNLHNMADVPSYQQEALAYHEGIPGHHMQRAIQVELQGVPAFQRQSGFTAYTEGWGLYAERLGKEMGFYQDPYSDFGRLALELWRACRLVVDTGLHDKGWTREETIDYLIKNTPNSEGDAIKSTERYIDNPGQATAYMIGQLKILELRERAKEELGEAFDIRAFHDEVLKDGPVPLDILEEKIDTWIARTKAA